jgi:hypothetical protein
MQPQLSQIRGSLYTVWMRQHQSITYSLNISKVDNVMHLFRRGKQLRSASNAIIEVNNCLHSLGLSFLNISRKFQISIQKMSYHLRIENMQQRPIIIRFNVNYIEMPQCAQRRHSAAARHHRSNENHVL